MIYQNPKYPATGAAWSNSGLCVGGVAIMKSIGEPPSVVDSVVEGFVVGASVVANVVGGTGVVVVVVEVVGRVGGCLGVEVLVVGAAVVSVQRVVKPLSLQVLAQISATSYP